MEMKLLQQMCGCLACGLHIEQFSANSLIGYSIAYA